MLFVLLSKRFPHIAVLVVFAFVTIALIYWIAIVNHLLDKSLPAINLNNFSVRKDALSKQGIR